MTINKLIIFLITITFILIGYGVAIPIAEYLRETQKANIYYLPLLFSLYSLGQLISAPIIGRIGDILGNKKVMIFSISIYIIVFVLSINVKQIGVVLVLRFLTGIFAGSTVLNIESYIGAYSEEDKRVLYFTLTSMAIALGMILGPVIGIAIIKYKLIISIVWVVVALGILVLLVKNVKNFEINPKEHSFLKDFVKEFLRAIKNPKNLYIFLGFFLLGIISSSLEAIGLGFMLDNFDISELNIFYSLCLVLFLVCFIIIGNTRISIRFNKYKYSMVMILIAASGLLLMGSSKNVNVLAFGFMLLILGLASVVSIMSTLITLEAEKNGMLLGIRNTVMGVGAIIGPILSTYLYMINDSLFLVFLSAICFLVILYAYVKKVYN